VELRKFGPDDAGEIQRFVDLDNAMRVDAPWEHRATTYRREMFMRHGWDGDLAPHYLAYDADRAVGYLVVHTSSYDNPELAWLGLGVHPGHRRCGHGTALLAAAADVCRGLGRPLVGIDGWESERTRGFAAATGFEQKSQSINRRQHLRELPGGLITGLCEEAEKEAGDYELVRLRGYSPDGLLDELAAITGAINDAPMDDLEIEDEVFPPERIRAHERAQIEGGFRFYRVLARHRGTGELAGQTVVTVAAEAPGIGDQHDTSVVRAHRGHRLGLLLKADLVRWLVGTGGVEPQLATIDTWNTESNDHMVGINERLDYRIIGRTLEFQRWV